MHSIISASILWLQLNLIGSPVEALQGVVNEKTATLINEKNSLASIKKLGSPGDAKLLQSNAARYSSDAEAMSFATKEFKRDWNKVLQAPESSTNRLPQLIWMYWDQGDLTSAPRLNRLCVQKWRDLNPTWKFNFVTRANVTSYLPEFAESLRTYESDPQQRSAFVRLQLLSKFGGTWVDMSVLPLMPLDAYATKAVANSGFFMFAVPGNNDPTFKWEPHQLEGRDRGGSPRLGSSWFVLTVPQSPLLEAWKAAFSSKWNAGKGKVPHYGESVMAHREVVLHSSDPRVQEVWKMMPHVSHDVAYGSSYSLCTDFWSRTPVDERPPMLKRPCGMHGKDMFPPTSWIAAYEGHLVNITKNTTGRANSNAKSKVQSTVSNAGELSPKAAAAALVRKMPGSLQ